MSILVLIPVLGLVSGERQFYFTPNYVSGNLTPYQDLMDFVYDYYED
ncbi:hypothetical protein [Photobacterium damselae]